jgi:hypothetical protein
MSMTQAQISKYFAASRRDQRIALKTTCDSCDRPGCTIFGAAFRQRERSQGRFDPGNLCAVCAALYERTIADIARGSLDG